MIFPDLSCSILRHDIADASQGCRSPHLSEFQCSASTIWLLSDRPPKPFLLPRLCPQLPPGLSLRQRHLSRERTPPLPLSRMRCFGLVDQRAAAANGFYRCRQILASRLNGGRSRGLSAIKSGASRSFAIDVPESTMRSSGIFNVGVNTLSSRRQRIQITRSKRAMFGIGPPSSAPG
jgi:hypothetical protein